MGRDIKFSSVGNDLTGDFFDDLPYITDARQIDKIILHCSASPQGRGDDAKTIDRWHKDRWGSGIGYHYIVLEDGTIQKGRWVDAAGAHAKGFNKQTIGVCRIGGHNGKMDITEEQKKSMVQICEVLMEGYDLQRNNILGHGELPNTNKTCPLMDMSGFRRLISLS